MSTTPEETDEPDVATWDPDAWLQGATSTVRRVTVYGRADLVAVVDDLDRRARAARNAPRAEVDDDRPLGDPAPDDADTIEDQLVEVHRQFEASALTLKVEGRSDARRKTIDKQVEKAAKKRGEEATTDEKDEAYIADAIIEPAGITPEWVRGFREKSESQYAVVLDAYAKASRMPPVVTVPSSGAGSGNRAQRRSS